MEANTLGISDVHRDAGMVCWDCHSQADIHGDGTTYQSMMEPGAMDAACENCHTELPAAHAGYNPHGDRLDCTACHLNFGGNVEAIQQYNDTGLIKFATLNEDGTLSWIHGVIPMPADYESTFKMDFITFDGDVSTPAGQDNLNWSSTGKDTWDGHQMLFATPLTAEQMEKLGFEEYVVTAVSDAAAAVPGTFALRPNFPNPFNNSTTIPYQLPDGGTVRLAIYDLSGQQVATLVDGVQGAGYHQASWAGVDAQGRPVSTGTYLASLQVGGRTQVAKLVLVK